MGNESKLTLAIRTILVTTRAAVRSNQATGRDDLAFESARRGEALLNDVGSRLPPDSSPELLARYNDAQGRMAVLVADASRQAVSIRGGDGAVQEEVDVRSELRPKLP